MSLPAFEQDHTHGAKPPVPAWRMARVRRRLWRVRIRRLYLPFGFVSFSEALSFLKGAATIMLAVIPTLLAAIVFVQALWGTPVAISALRVPESMEKMGFGPEAATQRLLDEVAALNRMAASAKPRTEVGDSSLLDAVSKLETPSASIDLKSIQGLLQTILGRSITRLSGEVTVRRLGDLDVLRLRVRRTPGHDVIVDVESANGYDELFSKGAMNLLENIDPQIAAGIYYREFNDVPTAFRLVNTAISRRDAPSLKYSLNLKSYIASTRGQFEEALALSDRTQKLDPSYFGAHLSRAVAFAGLKDTEASLAAARRGLEMAPQESAAHAIMGIVLMSLNRREDAIEAFRKSIELNPDSSIGYRRLANVYSSSKENQAAVDILLQGISVVRGSPSLLYQYGDQLTKIGRALQALRYFRLAHLSHSENWLYAVALAECEANLGNEANAARIARLLVNRIATGEEPPANLRDRVAALSKLTTAAAAAPIR